MPDVYSARVGGSFNLLPEQGLDGQSRRPHGRDSRARSDRRRRRLDDQAQRLHHVRRTGLSLSMGRERFSLSVPYRLKVNRQKSLFEQQTNGVNGGGFAKYLVFVGYSHSL